jgi:hypothetical protein
MLFPREYTGKPLSDEALRVYIMEFSITSSIVLIIMRNIFQVLLALYQIIELTLLI